MSACGRYTRPIVLNRHSLLVFRRYVSAQLHTLKASNHNHRLSPPWPLPELLQHRCVVLPQRETRWWIVIIGLISSEFGKRDAC